MALTITKLKMWKDPGYTRGCLEVPPMGSMKLPAIPDYTLAADETLRPHKGSTLTELHLPLSFTETFGMSYLYIEAEDGKGSVSLFGWITSIDQRSTAAEGVTIRWDVDWWRTYSGSVTFSHLHVKKTNISDYSRPLSTRPRKWVYKDKLNLIQHFENSVGDRDTARYPIFIFSYIDGSGELHFGLTTISFAIDGYTSYTGLGRTTIQTLPSMLGIQSSAIKGCWATPIIDPSCTMISGQLTFPSGVYVNLRTNGGKSWLDFPEAFNGFWSNVISTTEKWRTTDNERTQFTDALGTPYYTVPYDFEIKSISASLEWGATEAYGVFIFSESAVPSTVLTFNTDLPQAIAEGRYCIIPLVAVPIASSVLSDYYVSGQRDFDIEARKLDQERNMWNGFLGIGGSVAGGTIAGAMTGNPIGAAAGMAGGAVSGIGGTIANYWLTEQYNDRLQRATEQLYSNQAGQLITIGSTGKRINYTNDGFYFVKTNADTKSYDSIAGNISASGYDVDIYEGTPSVFLSAGCTTQLADVTILGAVPPEAKQAIKMKLQSGVIIVENNSSGVVP